MQERIEAFLEGSTALLAEMQPEDFEKHRQALIAAKMQQDHNLLEESERHWEQIQSRRYTHDRLKHQETWLAELQDGCLFTTESVGHACMLPCIAHANALQNMVGRHIMQSHYSTFAEGCMAAGITLHQDTRKLNSSKASSKNRSATFMLNIYHSQPRVDGKSQFMLCAMAT